MFNNPLNGSIGFRSVAPALESCAWMSVLLAPALRLANGPPVTDDQAVLQIATAAGSLIIALALRIYNWRAARST